VPLLLVGALLRSARFVELLLESLALESPGRGLLRKARRLRLKPRPL
jgi:hypothetical protein